MKRYPQPPSRRKQPAGPPYEYPDESAHKATHACSALIEAHIRQLGTATKTRVLLALHAHIGELLESLAETNNS